MRSKYACGGGGAVAAAAARMSTSAAAAFLPGDLEDDCLYHDAPALPCVLLDVKCRTKDAFSGFVYRFGEIVDDNVHTVW